MKNFIITVDTEGDDLWHDLIDRRRIFHVGFVNIGLFLNLQRNGDFWIDEGCERIDFHAVFDDGSGELGDAVPNGRQTRRF